jgi:hypothetical protein
MRHEHKVASNTTRHSVNRVQKCSGDTDYHLYIVLQTPTSEWWKITIDVSFIYISCQFHKKHLVI